VNIKALQDDECLRQEFGIQGRVTFYDRSNPSETSLENSLEQMNLQDARTPQHRFVSLVGHTVHAELVGAPIAPSCSASALLPLRRSSPPSSASPMPGVRYAVEFKAPHKMTIPELVAGLHQIDLALCAAPLPLPLPLPCLVFAGR
jgi:hypothetical protein